MIKVMEMETAGDMCALCVLSHGGRSDILKQYQQLYQANAAGCKCDLTEATNIIFLVHSICFNLN